MVWFPVRAKTVSFVTRSSISDPDVKTKETSNTVTIPMWQTGAIRKYPHEALWETLSRPVFASPWHQSGCGRKRREVDSVFKNSKISGGNRSANELLRERFAALDCDMSAFSSIHYVGTRTNGGRTDFSGLIRHVRQEIGNRTVRSPRSPKVILNMLQASYWGGG